MSRRFEDLDPAAWRRLVVVAPNWLGDAVMCEPAIRAVGERLPHLEIVWAGNPVSQAALRGHPSITQFHPLRDRGLVSMIRSARGLAGLSADAILVLRGSARSGMLARLSGIPTRIGIDGEGRGLLLTHAIPRPGSKRPSPTIALYRSLVETIGVDVVDATPRLDPSEAELAATATLFRGVEGPVLGIVPGGSKPSKRWPVERFQRVIGEVGARFGAVAVFGGPDERPLVRSVVSSAPGGVEVLDLPDRGLTLDNLRGAIGRCRLLLTNDTGPRHLGIALGVPTIGLFGPTDHRWTVVPGADERILLAEPFLDDDHVADHHPDACRIDRIPVSDVVAAIVEELESE